MENDMSILFNELKKWGNLGIPLKDVGTKIEKLNKSLEENKNVYNCR